MEAPEPGPCLTPARKLWLPTRVLLCLGLSAVHSGAGDPHVTIPQDGEGAWEPVAITGPRRPSPAGVAEVDSAGQQGTPPGGAGSWGPRWPPDSQVSGAACAHVDVMCTMGTDIHVCVGVLGCALAHTWSGGPPAHPRGSCRLRGPSGCRAVVSGLRGGATPQPPRRAHQSLRPVLPSSPPRGA